MDHHRAVPETSETTVLRESCRINAQIILHSVLPGALTNEELDWLQNAAT